jgi:hypothetical protein
MTAFGERRNYAKPFSDYGHLTVNRAGDITGGGIKEYGVHVKTFTGGTVTISAGRSVTGSIFAYLGDTDITTEYKIFNGHMNSGDIIVFAGKFHRSNRGIGILAKRRGTYSKTDLTGNWVFPMEGIISVSVDDTGQVSDCGFLSKRGDPGECRGMFSITPEGAVSGQIMAKYGRKKFTSNVNGQMNTDKNIVILAGDISTRLEGIATVAVRKDGVFSSSNWQGDWKIFLTEKGDVLYGTVSLKDSNIIKGGHWTMFKKGSGTFTGGNLSLTREGGISGSMNTSDGSAYSILGGQMSTKKDFAVIVVKGNSRYARVMILTKLPDLM